MSDANIITTISPPCPVCGSVTELKERFKGAQPQGDTCVFKCTNERCGVEYPVHAPDLLAMSQASPETP